MGISNAEWIFIDLDNTLVASNPIRLKIRFIYYFLKKTKNHGFSILESLSLLKLLEDSIYSSASIQSSNAHRVQNAFEKSSFSKKMKVENIQSLLISIFKDMLSEFKPIPGANEFISSLKPKYKLVLATNPIWPKEVTLMRLRLIGLSEDDFHLITHNQNMCSVKPQVSYYKELVEKLNTKSENCIMIGDNKVKDGIAEEIGIKTYIISKKKTLLEQFKEFSCE